MPDELKPCPFCGCKDVRVQDHRFVKDVFSVTCWSCPADMTGFPTEQDAIAAWNRRSQLLAVIEENERLRKLVEDAYHEGYSDGYDTGNPQKTIAKD
jgi:Lar family restriction alleviation protein